MTHPDDTRATLQNARRAYASGNYEEAKRLFAAAHNDILHHREVAAQLEREDARLGMQPDSSWVPEMSELDVTCWEHAERFVRGLDLESLERELRSQRSDTRQLAQLLAEARAEAAHWRAIAQAREVEHG